MRFPESSKWLILGAAVAFVSTSVRAQHMTQGLGPEVPVHGWFGLDGEAMALADLDGDEVDDLVTALVTASGDVYVALGDGLGGYGPSSRWAVGTTRRHTVLWGDVDADGDDDLIAFTQGLSGDVLVSRSSGTGLPAPDKWHDWFAPAAQTPLVGDFDGDGRADIASFAVGGSVRVALSTGAAFASARSRWATDFARAGDELGVGDFDGDGRDDLVTVTGLWPTRIRVARSLGTRFAAVTTWVASVPGGRADHHPLFGDMDGDGLTDISWFQGGELFVYASTGTGFVRQSWSSRQPVGRHTFALGRVDRDAKRDLVRFTPVADPGDPTSLADVYVRRAQRPWALLPGASQREAFGMGTLPAGPKALGRRPLLTVLARDPNQPPFAHPAAYYGELMHGPTNPGMPLVASGRNLRTYFETASLGAFTWANAGVVGPLVIEGSGALGESGRIQAVVIALGEAGFDFGVFDRSGDGDVTADELQLAIVDVFTDVGGANRYAACLRPPNNTVRVCAGPTVLIGHRASFGTIAHELVHAAGIHFELYGIDGFYGSSVMQATSGAWDDMASILPGPYERMRLGWLTPALVPADSPAATWAFDPAQAGDADPPFIVYDDKRGTRDYLMVEYRQASTAADPFYDRGIVWGDGVRVWALSTSTNHDPLVVDSWFGTAGKNVVAAIVGLDRVGDRPDGAVEGQVLGFGFPPAAADGPLAYAYSGHGANGGAVAMRLEVLDAALTGGVPTVVRTGPDGGLPTTFIDAAGLDDVYPGWSLVLDGHFGDPRTLELVMQRMSGRDVLAEIPLAVSSWSPSQVIAAVPPGTVAGTYRVRAKDPARSVAGRVTHGSWVQVRVH